MKDHSILPTSLGDSYHPSVAQKSTRIETGSERMDGLGMGDSCYIPLFSPQESRRLLEALLPGGEIEYQQWYHMPDRKKPHKPLRPLRRIKVAMTTAPQGVNERTPHYRFPVNDQNRYGVVSPMTPTVNTIRLQIEALLGRSFNHAVVLVYRDGDDGIGFHKDKMLDLDPDAPIVTISLGAARTMFLRDDIHEPTVQYELTLQPGAVFVIGPKTNTELYHAIPRQPERPLGPRVSLTFRNTLTYRDKQGHIHGQGDAYQSLNWPTELRGMHRLDAALDQPLER